MNCRSHEPSGTYGDLDRETGQKLAGLVSTPEVAILEIGDDTEFVLIASDGIWDGLRDQLALTTARKILRETRSPQAAAQAVLEAAGKVTKADNAAVVVVAVNIPEPLPKREPRQNRLSGFSLRQGLRDVELKLE